MSSRRRAVPTGPVPGRTLVERSSSEDCAQASVPPEDLHGGSSKGKPALTMAILLATVRALQKQQPRGARFAEILHAMEPAFPTHSTAALRRELLVLVKRAISNKKLHRDLSYNYTVYKRTLEDVQHKEQDTLSGMESWWLTQEVRRKEKVGGEQGRTKRKLPKSHRATKKRQSL